MELPFKAFHGGVIDKRPFVNGGAEIVPKTLPDTFFVSPLQYQFLGIQGSQQGANIFQRSLGHLELPGGNIQEGGSALILFKHQPAEEIVFLHLQHVFPKGNARRYNFRNAALDQFLGKLGVFQLVADGHFESGPNQFGEVILQGVMRKTSHSHRSFFPVGFLSLDQAQHPGGRNGIVRIAFIEVSHPVQEESFGVLCLHLEIMTQHGGIFRYLCHELQIYNLFLIFVTL